MFIQAKLYSVISLSRKILIHNQQQATGVETPELLLFNSHLREVFEER